jgi:hypothetical protein
MSLSSTALTAEEFKARLAAQRAKKQQLRAEEDARMEQEAEAALADIEAERVRVEEEAKRLEQMKKQQEKDRRKLNSLEAAYAKDLDRRAVVRDGKRKASAISVDGNEGEEEGSEVDGGETLVRDR